MKKKFYESMTFWGAFGWAIVGILDAYSAVNPQLGTAAKAITTGLIAFGFRRAVK